MTLEQLEQIGEKTLQTAAEVSTQGPQYVNKMLYQCFLQMRDISLKMNLLIERLEKNECKTEPKEDKVTQDFTPCQTWEEFESKVATETVEAKKQNRGRRRKIA